MADIAADEDLAACEAFAKRLTVHVPPSVVGARRTGKVVPAAQNCPSLRGQGRGCNLEMANGLFNRF
jgi:hypothetical protein